MSWGRGEEKQQERKSADEKKEIGYLTFLKDKHTHKIKLNTKLFACSTYCSDLKSRMPRHS